MYQCAFHEAWHCNILTAEKMIHSAMILITRSANISNYVLMDECVIVGGDWDPCAGRTRNQKDPKCRTFPFTYVNPSRQVTSPSTAQLTGAILNDVSVKTPLFDAFVVGEGSAVLPQALGKYLNSA